MFAFSRSQDDGAVREQFSNLLVDDIGRFIGAAGNEDGLLAGDLIKGGGRDGE